MNDDDEIVTIFDVASDAPAIKMTKKEYREHNERLKSQGWKIFETTWERRPPPECGGLTTLPRT